MGHEEVVLQGLSMEAPRLTAPAALRARLARLAALAVPPTRPRRLEEPEHLGLALAPHRADQGVSTRIDRRRAGQIRAVEAFQERDVSRTLRLVAARRARADDGPELVQRGPRDSRDAKPGSFHYFYNVMPSMDEIFGSLVIYAVGEGPVNQRTSEMRASRQS